MSRRCGGDDLVCYQVDAWEETVTRHRALGGRASEQTGLGDFGADAGVVDPLPVRLPTAVADAPQAFVKFLGEGVNRVPLSFPTIEEIKLAGCHWAVAYPASKRPGRVQDDAIIFIARLTSKANDIRRYRAQAVEGKMATIYPRPSRRVRRRDDILQEVLLKNGFMLDVQTESLTDFTENVVFRAWDSQKEATVCLDYDLKEQTIAKLKGMEGIFICLEQALNTTKKWNLHVEFGERLVAF